MTDYVIPMVFDGDIKWRQDYLQKLCSLYDRDRHRSEWRSMRNEELLIRCIRTFMPFVGTIIILLARESQWQAWMKQKGIRVVYHREFIPAQYLPTFSTERIREYVKDIPGLSEDYILADRFILPLSPLDEWKEPLRVTALEELSVVEGVVDVRGLLQGDTFDQTADLISSGMEDRLYNYKEKTYGTRTENRTAGTGAADATSIPDEQRRDGGDDTPHEEKVQDQMAEKRPADKTDKTPAPQDRRGKGKNNGKRSFRFDSRGQ